jgi:hypothetical protein
MFTTPGSLLKRTGKHGADRPTYIRQLVEEYESPNTTHDYREQILANLGNFAYDPINYEYFRRFNVIDLFVKCLDNYTSGDNASTSLNMLNFSLAGLCNLCLDEKNKQYLLNRNIITLCLKCLSKLVYIQKDENQILEHLLNLLTMLIFLIDSNTSKIIVNYSDQRINFIALINKYSKSMNKRLANLAQVFLNDYLMNSKQPENQSI